MNNKEKYDLLISEINWENWEKETPEQCDEQIEYWDICEVLSSKLQWVKEELNGLYEEHLNTINQVQTLLSLLNENKIKSVL